MGSRTWIKIYCDKWLSGTLREETSQLRGVWADVLALAGNLNYGDVGQISLPNNIPLTNKQIAGILNISIREWERGKSRLIETQRITTDDDIIKVINWEKYQSEYQRQKPLRKVISESYNPKLQAEVLGDREGDREGDKIENKDLNPFVKLFNLTALNLVKVSAISKTRKTKIQNRLKEHPDLEWWRKVFEKANAILFEDKKTQRTWRPSFDWLIKNDNNALSISEGTYDKPPDWRDKYNDKT